MARKRHGGLGRGLDALIPQVRKEDAYQKDDKDPAQDMPEKKDNISESDGQVRVSTETSGMSVQTEQQGQDRESSGNSTEVKDTGSFSIVTGADNTEAGNAGEGSTGNPSVDIRDGLADSEDASSGAQNKESAPNYVNVQDDVSGQGIVADVQGEEKLQGEVRMLRLSQVDPNRSQPRTKFEEESLEELADSIRQFGVLQPILVQKKGSRYEIIAGERRWRASRKAGLKEIPAIVRDYSGQEAVELSLIENIQREDLNPIEEAKAFKRLLDEFGMRQEDLAVRVSKSRTAITNAIRLLKLDERVQEMVMDEKISMGHARALISVEIPEEQYLLAKQVEEKQLSVRDVEKLVKKIGQSKTKKKGPGKTEEKDPALELAYKAIEERLKQALGTKASIHHGGNGTGKLEIEFYSHEDLEKIVDLLT